MSDPCAEFSDAPEPEPYRPPYPQIVAVYRDCEALLAGRNAGAPELIHAELRRMRGELDRAIRAVEDMAEQGEGSGA